MSQPNIFRDLIVVDESPEAEPILVAAALANRPVAFHEDLEAVRMNRPEIVDNLKPLPEHTTLWGEVCHYADQFFQTKIGVILLAIICVVVGLILCIFRIDPEDFI